MRPITSFLSRISSMPCVALVLLLLAVPATIGYASDADIKKKEKALQKLRTEIEAYETRISDSEHKEKVTLERLDDMERQVSLLQTLLLQIQHETTRLRTDIDTTETSIAFFEAQLSYLQTQYARYVASVYKYGRIRDLETLLSSNSINQLYIRLQYLKLFTHQRKNDVNRIREKKKLLEGRRLALEENLLAERELMEEKEIEGHALLAKKEARTRVLKDIRKDKSIYQKELTRKTEAAQQLGNLIAELIENDRIRKEREAQRERERLAKVAAEREAKRLRDEAALRERQRELERLRETKQADKIREKEREIERGKQSLAREQVAEVLPGEPDVKTFSTLRGTLMWPITKGRVVAQFGEQIHPVLKTVTQNTGIDIAVPGGTSIRTVAGGEVALIHWLPSYGNLIIVNHNNGYRTVYTHLSEISVAAGQALAAGDVIGRSGDSVSGSILHFEIWKDKVKQNPELWLAHRK